MDQARDQFLVLDGRRFHYREWGPIDGSPLLLLHGVWDSVEIWNPVAPSLGERNRVLALELRGHGPTEWASSYGTPDFLEDVRAFIEALGLAPVTLAGHSLGGIIALMYAARYPDRVTRLVVMDHSPDAVHSLRPVLARIGAPIVPRLPTDPALSSDQILVLFDQPPLDEEWAMLPRITAPTLVVRAANSDRFHPKEAGRMLRELRDGRLVEIPASRHQILKDNPAALLAEIQTFLWHD